jgi:heme oxygenase
MRAEQKVSRVILDFLRDQTRHLHEQVERTVDLPARLRSVAHYASLLARFFGFYAPLEERLAGVGGYDAVGLDLAARRKTHLLRADLTTLGLGAADIDSLARCDDLPVVSDLSSALGCLYVLEGATLGGQIVRRQAPAQLGLTPGSGCSFFASYGERVGPMWQEFCRTLGQYAAATPGADERVVAAAAGTFGSLDRWLAGGAA